MLTEDCESENMHKAQRWIEQNHSDIIGRTLQNSVIAIPQKIIEEIRNMISNVRLAGCKFLLGLTCMYFQLQAGHEIQSKFNNFNKILKIICTRHVDEYDNDLNGMTYDKLDSKFSTAVQRELNSDKEEIDKLVLMKNDNDYEIIPIDSFEQAKNMGSIRASVSRMILICMILI